MGQRLATTALLGDSGGLAMTEYVIVVALVTLIGAGAVVLLGIPMLHAFRYAQLIIASPI